MDAVLEEAPCMRKALPTIDMIIFANQLSVAAEDLWTGKWQLFSQLNDRAPVLALCADTGKAWSGFPIEIAIRYSSSKASFAMLWGGPIGYKWRRNVDYHRRGGYPQ
jgi:hypothetical protein